MSLALAEEFVVHLVFIVTDMDLEWKEWMEGMMNGLSILQHSSNKKKQGIDE